MEEALREATSQMRPTSAEPASKTTSFTNAEVSKYAITAADPRHTPPGSGLDRATEPVGGLPGAPDESAKAPPTPRRSAAPSPRCCPPGRAAPLPRRGP